MLLPIPDLKQSRQICLRRNNRLAVVLHRTRRLIGDICSLSRSPVELLFLLDRLGYVLGLLDNTGRCIMGFSGYLELLSQIGELSSGPDNVLLDSVDRLLLLAELGAKVAMQGRQSFSEPYEEYDGRLVSKYSLSVFEIKT